VARPLPIAVAPGAAPGWMADAVRAGGGEVVDLERAEALVWGSPTRPADLAAALADAPSVRWVQLPWAGIERFVTVIDRDRTWTCAKGVYAEPVAELALTLALAGLRGLSHYARSRSWQGPRGRNLLGARVTILGGGGITESLVRLLRPFDAPVTVVRNRVRPMDGTDRVVGPDELHSALAGADLVVLALALTPQTERIIGTEELALLGPSSWLVNVARGRHVDTEALVVALRDERIGGAGLDVTDPEPLPDDHELWSLPTCLVTPHVGNTPEMARPLLAERITANVRRYGAGEPLLGLVEPELGY